MRISSKSGFVAVSRSAREREVKQDALPGGGVRRENEEEGRSERSRPRNKVEFSAS